MKKFLKLSAITLSIISFLSSNSTLAVGEDLFDDVEKTIASLKKFKKKLVEKENQENESYTRLMLNKFETLFPEAFKKAQELSTLQMNLAKKLEEHKGYLVQINCSQEINGLIYNSDLETLKKLEDNFDILQKNLNDQKFSEAYKQIEILLDGKLDIGKKLETLKDHLTKIKVYDSIKDYSTFTPQKIKEIEDILDAVIEGQEIYSSDYIHLEKICQDKKYNTTRKNNYLQLKFSIHIPASLVLIVNAENFKNRLDIVCNFTEENIKYLAQINRIDTLEFDCKNQPVNDFNFENLKNIESLTFKNTTVNSLEKISKIAGISYLEFNTAKVGSELDFSVFKNLDQVSFENTNLESLPKGLENITYLSFLNSGLENLDDKQIKSLTSLKELSLNNYEKTIKKSPTYSEELKKYFEEKGIKVTQ
jgi:hypothetical protein